MATTTMPILEKLGTPIAEGAHLDISHKGELVGRMVVTRIKNYRIDGQEGAETCKLTLVGQELRWYAPNGSNREAVFHGVMVQVRTKAG